MILRQLQLFLSLEKWPSRDCQVSQVSHAIAIEAERVEVVQASFCCTTHSGQDLGGRKSRQQKAPLMKSVESANGWLLVWGPGGFGYLGIPL